MNYYFLSKNLADPYINLMAAAAGCRPLDQDFDYNDSNCPIFLRGILKHKLMKQCWEDARTFYYVDTGYFGNHVTESNPRANKLWHRIVKNNIQHNEIRPKPSDRFDKLHIEIPYWKKSGSSIIVAAPDEKPCRFYGIDCDTWISETVATIKQYTDRPVVVRRRNSNKKQRMVLEPFEQVLESAFAVVTFNSNAATQAILAGIPAFVLAPVHAASPVASKDLSKIDTPYYPDRDKLYSWACYLAYGQIHVNEMKNGKFLELINYG